MYPGNPPGNFKLHAWPAGLAPVPSGPSDNRCAVRGGTSAVTSTHLGVRWLVRESSRNEARGRAVKHEESRGIGTCTPQGALRYCYVDLSSARLEAEGRISRGRLLRMHTAAHGGQRSCRDERMERSLIVGTRVHELLKHLMILRIRASAAFPLPPICLLPLFHLNHHHQYNAHHAAAVLWASCPARTLAAQTSRPSAWRNDSISRWKIHPYARLDPSRTTPQA